MTAEFNLQHIYEHNLNFLIGAGASYGFLPTLALGIKNEHGIPMTFETLAKRYEDEDDIITLLFMLYFRQCIKPGLPKLKPLGENAAPRPPERESVINEYKRFMTTLVHLLNKQKPSSRKANIFTTNYDNCFEIASEELMGERWCQFEVNDGGAGFQTKTFHTKNFNKRVVNRGVFDRHDYVIPQVNLLHAHGSVHWVKSNGKGDIELNYGDSTYNNIEFLPEENNLIDAFEQIVNDPNGALVDLDVFGMTTDLSVLRKKQFWSLYEQIPIVNPTKWKFHQTVFEEAYYQILRYLSYELERPHSVLITFGFSFADEHILSLVQRSLSNPSLTMYVICYNEQSKSSIEQHFQEYPNVKCICSDDGVLDFKKFNDKYFSIGKTNGGTEIVSPVDELAVGDLK